MTARRGIAPAKLPVLSLIDKICVLLPEYKLSEIEIAFDAVKKLATSGTQSAEAWAAACKSHIEGKTHKRADAPRCELTYEEKQSRENAELLRLTQEESKEKIALNEAITDEESMLQQAQIAGANMTPTDAAERAEWHRKALQGRSDVEARQLSREQRLERERLARWQAGQTALQTAAVPTQIRARAFCLRMAQGVRA